MKGKEKLREILESYKEQCIDFDVYIIADTQNKTSRESDTRVHHADESEFFSRKEFAEIASAIFYVFGFAKVFYDEVSFINYFITNKISPEGCIVYNLARDGIQQGKKSLIPAFCDLYGIKYTGSNAFVISLLREKALYTDILSLHNILVPLTLKYFPGHTSKEELMRYFDHRDILVKNVCESASIGLSSDCRIMLTNETYPHFCRVANLVNSKQVLVQQFIEGKECELLVLQHKGEYYALDPVRITFPDGKQFINSEMSNNYDYDFEMLPEEECPGIRQAAIQAATLLGIKDYARFDFRVQDGKPYLFDMAGTPYTIQHSSIAYLFKQYGLKYTDIYKVIVTCMLSNYRKG